MKTHLTLLHLLLCLTGLLGCCLYGRAQAGRYYMKGEQLFAQKDYYAAAQYYEAFLGTGKRSQPLALQKIRKNRSTLNPYQAAAYHLAYCYLQLHDFVQAEKWYGNAASYPGNVYPELGYWYGITLRANGKYAAALDALNGFKNACQSTDSLCVEADRELASLHFIQAQLARADTNRVQLDRWACKDHRSDYAIRTRKGGRPVFTGVHAVGDGKNTAEFRNDLYTDAATSIDSVHLWTDVRLIDLPREKNGQNGLAAFSADGKEMFFTRWTKQGTVSRSAIWSSDWADTGWTEPRLLPSPINVEGYNSTQPFVTSDDHYLLFASDRPGGSGRYDLWYAELDCNGSALSVANMGTTINTSGDEESPFYHASSHTLVFSSNGRVGMGGFDIYYAQGELDPASWDSVENPGIPINSTKDDLYFISTDALNCWNSGWLSSDRDSGCCLALYALKKNVPPSVSDSSRVPVPVDTPVIKTAPPLTYAAVLDNFAFSKSTLPSSVRSGLDALVDFMKAHPETRIRVSGYTDGIGSDAYNLRLAQARVDACIDYLVQYGIDSKRLIGRAMGKCCPVAQETVNGRDNPAAREKNRRVECQLID